MGCYSLKKLSYISAGLHMFYCFVYIIVAIVWAVLMNSSAHNNKDIYSTKLKYFITVGFVLSVLGIGLLATLILGIKKNRLILVTIYVDVTYTFLAICCLFIVADTIVNILSQKTFKHVLIELFMQVAIMGFEIFLLTPIFLIHSRMEREAILPIIYSEIQDNSYWDSVSS